jgi:predicted polyphosphate/ATP-dependent NAD kinase
VADTKRIVREMIRKGVELLIFVGGDVTARDIYDELGLKIPVVGIPSGVKMFSPVFALSPTASAAAEIIDHEGNQYIEKEVNRIWIRLIRCQFSFSALTFLYLQNI